MNKIVKDALILFAYHDGDRAGSRSASRFCL